MRLALAVLLTSASLVVCPQPARGGWGAKPPSSREARFRLAVPVAPVPGSSSPRTRPFPSSPPRRPPSTSAGPGREEPEPAVDEVVLGWFGPGDPATRSSATSGAGRSSRSSRRTRQEGTAADSLQWPSAPGGKPFRLVPAWSESPWKAGIADLTRLVYDQRAWAVIGGVDGTTTHLAVQVALKSHFLLLSPGSTDASADHANVPWLFSLPPSDDRIAPVLADAVARAARGGPLVVAAATDHDSHATLVALRRMLSERRLTPAALVELSPLEPDLPAAGRPPAAWGAAGAGRPCTVEPGGSLDRGSPRGGLPWHHPRRCASGPRRVPPRGWRGGGRRDRAPPGRARAGVGRVCAGVCDALGRASRRGRGPRLRCGAHRRRCDRQGGPQPRAHPRRGAVALPVAGRVGPRDLERARAERTGRGPRLLGRRSSHGPPPSVAPVVLPGDEPFAGPPPMSLSVSALRAGGRPARALPRRGEAGSAARRSLRGASPRSRSPSSAAGGEPCPRGRSRGRGR